MVYPNPSRFDGKVKLRIYLLKAIDVCFYIKTVIHEVSSFMLEV